MRFLEFLPPASIAYLLLAVAPTAAWYIPGNAPREFQDGELVPFLVNSLSGSTNEQHQELGTLLSYDYYRPEFGFCRPEEVKAQPEGLGSILAGDRLYNSPYNVRMKQNATCQVLCMATISKEDAEFTNARIVDGLAINWLVDGLPAAEPRYRDEKEDSIYLSPGFALGTATYSVDGEVATTLNNHYNIHLEYHNRPGDRARVISVTVSTDSYAEGNDCSSSKQLSLSTKHDNRFAYTYSVTWQESPVLWSTRFDSYLTITNPQIHWFALINSISVAGFLCVMVGLILYRTVNKDLYRYNAMDLASVSNCFPSHKSR